MGIIQNNLRLKKLFSNLILYTLIGIFALGVVMVYAGIGEDRSTRNHFNGTFVIIGLVILLPFSIYFIKIFHFDQRKESRKQQKIISELKTNWVKLTVDLESINIDKSSKSFSSKVIHNTARSGALNQIMENPDPHIHITEYNINEIKFKIPYGNNFIKFTKTIDMEPTKLLLHFAVKKETYLYVNPTNMKEYYLDLEFLHQ